VPAGTPSTGKDVFIAGEINRLDPSLPLWNPGGVKMDQVDATHWTKTIDGREGTPAQYKYVLGDWPFVEKSGTCDEIANRSVTLAFGSGTSQTVNDTVTNWRNVAPCGN
jgi:hypothetical protein